EGDAGPPPRAPEVDRPRARSARARPPWSRGIRWEVVRDPATIGGTILSKRARAAMHSTNLRDAFIAVAPDCPATGGTAPRQTARPSTAWRLFSLIHERPYQLTSDDALFTVYADKNDIPRRERAAARKAFFARPQACLRASELGKRYGWGIHHDGEARVALHGVETAEYQELARGTRLGSDGRPVTVKRAFRSGRGNTGETMHAGVLVPAIAEAARRLRARAVAIIDVGHPAGPNLRIDQVFVRYTSGQSLGDPSSAIQESCTLRGEGLLPDLALPDVVARVGIERDRLASLPDAVARIPSGAAPVV